MEEQALRGLGTVRVSKSFLLNKLESNRETHRSVFEEALEGWHNEVLRSLKEEIKRAKANKRYNPQYYLPMPEDHTTDYDSVIEMVNASLDTEFVLTSQEFNQYVRDDWRWKADFMNTANNYTNKGRI